MKPIATLIGTSNHFEPTAEALKHLPGCDVQSLQIGAEDLLDLPVEPDFLIVAYAPGDQEEVIIRELAADRHLLGVEHLAATAEDAQRCVTIALNRGLRLGVMKLTEPAGPQIEQFAAWIEGGAEPENSGRRWLSRRFGREGAS